MKRFARFVTIWLGLGLALTVLAVATFGRQLHLEQLEDKAHFQKVVMLVGLSWLVFGVAMGGFSDATYKKSFHFHFVQRFSRTLNTLLLFLILFCALRIGFAVVPGYEKLSLAGTLDKYLGPVWAGVTHVATRVHLPASLGKLPIGPLLLGAVATIARIWVNWGQREMAKAVETTAGPSRAGARLAGRARDPEAEKRALAASRKVAVSAYTEAKSVLETTEIPLTFLSLDVVGSTKMKHGEDPYVIEQAFHDYRALVEKMLQRHDAYKQTWTPDGQMAAFQSPQSAVACAQEILTALVNFNSNVSKMKTPFSVRAGANWGVVSTDDATPMERMSDFSIDVAGHMQKYADPDSLWLSEALYQQLTDTAGIEANGEEVDNRKVFVWKRA